MCVWIKCTLCARSASDQTISMVVALNTRNIRCSKLPLCFRRRPHKVRPIAWFTILIPTSTSTSTTEMNPIPASTSASTSKDAADVEAVSLKFDAQLSVGRHIVNQALFAKQET